MTSKHPPRRANCFGLLSLATLLVAGCETTPLMTERKADADFSHYRTFALRPLPEAGSAKDAERALLLGRAAHSAAVSALVAKGYAEVSPAEADFSVGLQGQSLPKGLAGPTGFVQSVQTGRGRIAVQGPGSEDSRAYDERTLRIEIFDRRSQDKVWAGWMQKLSAEPSQPLEVQNAVRRIISKFPSATMRAALQP